MKIVVAGGGWSTNIGNSFFNLGTLYLLKQILPHTEMVLFSDQPANLDFFRRKSPKNSLNIFNYIQPDYLVLHGSVLTKHLPQIWGESLEIMQKRGTKIVFISAGLSEYSKMEIEICKSFFEKNPPFLFVSRDSETYENFFHFAEYSYDGIDSAFFLPDAFTPIEVRIPPYIILNFDKSPEPSVCVSKGKEKVMKQEKEKGKYLHVFEFADKIWKVEFPPLRYNISKRLQRFYPFLESLLLFSGKKPTHIDTYGVIRTDHGLNPVIIRKIFRGPNSFCWDIAYPYICLYANTTLALTDRIHAAVVTLAYGKPAMLFSASGRSRILERTGAKNICKRPTYLDQEMLIEEKKKLMDFLKKCNFQEIH